MRNAFPRVACVLAALVLVAMGTALPAAAQCVSYTGSTYTQNFDTLANTAGSTTNNLAITGWYLTESGGGARDNEQYAVDTGSSTTGDTYSYGAAASTERALGGLQSGTLVPLFGACFTNDSGSTLTALEIAYMGEEWRLGTAGRTDQINFEYSTNATNLTTGTWSGVAALNFVTPDTVTTGAKNGNAASERTAKSAILASLSIPNGATFWIRWTDVNASGADDGLAVDDFSLAPVLPTLSVSDVSAFEGNSGSQQYHFVVTLSSVSPTNVTFDVASADGTATTADGDYVANSATGATILAGDTTADFYVTVNGDTTVEPDETFTVTISNPSANATIATGTATGTIRNDDGTPDLTITDATAAEGDVGTKTFTFTVGLSWPAPADVTFDIATADGSATAGSDYVASSLTGQKILAGAMSATFPVTVNGDIDVETTETFDVNVTNVSGANVVDGQGLGTIQNDDQAATFIHDLQGSGAATPVPGTAVTIDGVVVASYQGTSGLGGFFVEEETADQDSDEATSEGIFVYDNTHPVAVGDRVVVAGTVVEYNNLTEIGPTTKVSVMSSGNSLPAPVELTLPASPDPATAWERYEGMRVHFNQALAITNTFDMATYGEVGLSFGGVRIQPTNVIDPNDDPASGTSYSGSGNVAAVTAAATANANNLITLDDGRNGTNLSPETYDPTSGAMRLGNTVTELTGVMTYQFNTYMVEPTVTPVFAAANPRPPAPPIPASVIKVGFQNTLNFFVDVGTGRGAANALEFDRQRTKLVAALQGIGADVIGLSELQKLPSSPQPLNAAAQSLAAGLTAATGHPWAATTDPWGCEILGTAGCNPGTDPDIKCGIVYDTTKVTPSGASFTDTVAAAGTYSRAPYTQIFTINATGGKFGLVVNHLRSKGSCPPPGDPNADQGDGQGCYNLRRTSQALATSTFVASSSFSGVPNVFLVGDMNAYGEEDPIDAFRFNGFVDLIGAATSYSFGGQSGHIDHALASPTAASYVTGAGVWHINADEPVVSDYVMSGKPADAPYSADAYRSSDHDPVVLGFTVATAAVSGGGTVCAGQSASIQAALTGRGPWDVTWSDGVTQSGVATSPATRSVSPSATTSYTVTAVADSTGPGLFSGSANVTVNPLPATPTAGSNAPLCEGMTLALTTPTVTGASYSWTGPNGFNSLTQNPSIPTVTIAAAGTYSVTITDGNSCVSLPGTVDVVVNADFPPSLVTPAPIRVDQSLCCGTFGGANAATSAPLTAFLNGATVTDDCGVPTLLPSQVDGKDVTGTTCFEAGTTTVMFRCQDAGGHTSSAPSYVTVGMFGDLNEDALVDPSDMVIMRAYFNFAITPGTPPFTAPARMADLTHDAAVDPSDMVVLRAYFNFAVSCLAP